ncbi:hypothetical protein BU16DRAFT_601058 [Lophium mytilinum]|uniref:Uncharacterized protein n=1 Tax=Lophium mytilinum TaxID=390894 RepID=A0A6A6Q9V2_9PEZI|nr:hypothetical protein BU16DRAFT_601058 [Lophium mytilinum]
MFTRSRCIISLFKLHFPTASSTRAPSITPTEKYLATPINFAILLEPQPYLCRMEETTGARLRKRKAQEDAPANPPMLQNNATALPKAKGSKRAKVGNTGPIQLPNPTRAVQSAGTHTTGVAQPSTLAQNQIATTHVGEDHLMEDAAVVAIETVARGRRIARTLTTKSPEKAATTTKGDVAALKKSKSKNLKEDQKGTDQKDNADAVQADLRPRRERKPTAKARKDDEMADPNTAEGRDERRMARWAADAASVPTELPLDIRHALQKEAVGNDVHVQGAQDAATTRLAIAYATDLRSVLGTAEDVVFLPKPNQNWPQLTVAAPDGPEPNDLPIHPDEYSVALRHAIQTGKELEGAEAIGKLFEKDWTVGRYLENVTFIEQEHFQVTDPITESGEGLPMPSEPSSSSNDNKTKINIVNDGRLQPGGLGDGVMADADGQLVGTWKYCPLTVAYKPCKKCRYLYGKNKQFAKGYGRTVKRCHFACQYYENPTPDLVVYSGKYRAVSFHDALKLPGQMAISPNELRELGTEYNHTEAVRNGRAAEDLKKTAHLLKPDVADPDFRVHRDGDPVQDEEEFVWITMHRCEKMIPLLRRVNDQINQTAPEKRRFMIIPADFTGTSEALPRMVFRDVYGKDPGDELMIEIQRQPVLMIPIVLEGMQNKLEGLKKRIQDLKQDWIQERQDHLDRIESTFARQHEEAQRTRNQDNAAIARNTRRFTTQKAADEARMLAQVKIVEESVKSHKERVDYDQPLPMAVPPQFQRRSGRRSAEEKIPSAFIQAPESHNRKSPVTETEYQRGPGPRFVDDRMPAVLKHFTGSLNQAALSLYDAVYPIPFLGGFNPADLQRSIHYVLSKEDERIQETQATLITEDATTLDRIALAQARPNGKAYADRFRDMFKHLYPFEELPSTLPTAPLNRSVPNLDNITSSMPVREHHIESLTSSQSNNNTGGSSRGAEVVSRGGSEAAGERMDIADQGTSTGIANPNLQPPSTRLTENATTTSAPIESRTNLGKRKRGLSLDENDEERMPAENNGPNNEGCHESDVTQGGTEDRGHTGRVLRPRAARNTQAPARKKARLDTETAQAGPSGSAQVSSNALDEGSVGAGGVSTLSILANEGDEDERLSDEDKANWEILDADGPAYERDQPRDIVVRRRHKITQEVVIWRYKHADEVDWSNQDWITIINSWRRLYIRRCGGSRIAGYDRRLWSPEELDWIETEFRREVQNMPGGEAASRAYPGWVAMFKRFQAKFGEKTRTWRGFETKCIRFMKVFRNDGRGGEQNVEREADTVDLTDVNDNSESTSADAGISVGDPTNGEASTAPTDNVSPTQSEENTTLDCPIITVRQEGERFIFVVREWTSTGHVEGEDEEMPDWSAANEGNGESMEDEL